MTAHDEAPRPDNWRTRARRYWPAVATYVLAAGGSVWAAAWTVATDPGLVAAVLVGVATSNTVCAVVGVVRLVRS